MLYPLLNKRPVLPKSAIRINSLNTFFSKYTFSEFQIQIVWPTLSHPQFLSSAFNDWRSYRFAFLLHPNKQSIGLIKRSEREYDRLMNGLLAEPLGGTVKQLELQVC